MKLLIKDTHMALGDLTKFEQLNIIERFTYKDQSKAMTRGGFDKKKVKKVRFSITKGNNLIMRTGFLKELILHCKSLNIKITDIDDRRTKFPHQRDYDFSELRKYFNPDFKYVDHQMRALRMLLKTNLGIIKAPTSAGKTEIIIALMKITKLPTLILVDNVSLANQTMERIDEAGLNCGICHGKGKILGTHMCSTIQSAKKLNLSDYTMLIIDECHIAGAKGFQEFLEKTSYPLRFGFSATPDGNDAYRFATIRQHIGDVIEEILTDELIENDVMTKPEIHFKSVSCIPTMDWQAAYDANIVENVDRNQLVANLANESGTPTLVLVKIIEHGEKIMKLLKEDALYLHGGSSIQEREDAIHKFKKGEVRILVASNIFKQGVSINNIECLINASGGKSKIEVLQKIGRGLRKSPGKDVALVYDFLDEGNDFTYRHSLQRERLYREAGFEDIRHD